MERQLPQGFLISGLSEEAILRWLVLFLALLIGGAAGLIAVVVAQLMLQVARTTSTARVSNVGGLVVVAFVWASVIWYEWIIQLSIFNDVTAPILLTATVFGLLGFVEDFAGRFLLNKKLAGMLVMLVSLMLIQPELMFKSVGIAWFDNYILQFAPLAFVFTLGFVVFTVNAFNTADGANGLVSGVSLMAFIGLIQHGLGITGGLLALVALGCGIFMMFNIIVGRIFMGDGGAYFLGATMALSLISVCNNGIESPWYLLSLIFYPHADLLFSMVRRKGAGKAMFGADNGHLHNLIYRKLSSIPFLTQHANTITGLSVAFVFGALPLLMWNLGLQAEWLWVYCLQWFIYAVVWGLLADRQIRDVDTSEWVKPVKL